MEQVIIAGPTRTGTTSLFRYFQQNQKFVASNIKETNFFITGDEENGSFALDAYRKVFRDDREGNFFLEASPKYFLGGREIAERIKENLGDAKIIITLRDPVERFISLYVHILTKRSMDRQFSFDDFVRQNISYEKKGSYELNDLDLLSFYEGCYADIFPEWIDCCGAENVKVIFFEEMAADTAPLMDIVQWLGLSGEDFSYDRFLHENKATFYKNKALHKVSMGLNDLLEPFFNRNQQLREKVRDVYYLLNGKKSDREIRRSDGFLQLKEAYLVKNQSLKEYLQGLGYVCLPDWLED